MIELTKPGTPQELMLEHHGVLGMRWGQHRARVRAGRESHGKAKAEFLKKNPTPKKQARAIYRARAETQRDAVRFRTAPRGSAERKKLKSVYLKNPDRATALRITRGEKLVIAALTLGVVSVPVVAVGVGAQVGVRRRIERKQAQGRYK